MLRSVEARAEDAREFAVAVLDSARASSIAAQLHRDTQHIFDLADALEDATVALRRKQRRRLDDERERQVVQVRLRHGFSLCGG